jgi:hypothetical protein
MLLRGVQLSESPSIPAAWPRSLSSMDVSTSIGGGSTSNFSIDEPCNRFVHSHAHSDDSGNATTSQTRVDRIDLQYTTHDDYAPQSLGQAHGNTRRPTNYYPLDCNRMYTCATMDSWRARCFSITRPMPENCKMAQLSRSKLRMHTSNANTSRPTCPGSSECQCPPAHGQALVLLLAS